MRWFSPRSCKVKEQIHLFLQLVDCDPSPKKLNYRNDHIRVGNNISPADAFCAAHQCQLSLEEIVTTLRLEDQTYTYAQYMQFQEKSMQTANIYMHVSYR